MLIVVNHQISDVPAFWKSAQESLPNLPAGIKIHQVMPSPDMSTGVCLWEADNIQQLTDYLNSKVGSVSTNTYMEVNTANAMGLPA